MSNLMRNAVLICSLVLCAGAPLVAQDKGTPTQHEKVEKQETPPSAPAPRDNTSILAYYVLALVGTVIIVLAVCWPIRRR